MYNELQQGLEILGMIGLTFAGVAYFFALCLL
jgi:hypothetical protein